MNEIQDNPNSSDTADQEAWDNVLESKESRQFLAQSAQQALVMLGAESENTEEGLQELSEL